MCQHIHEGVFFVDEEDGGEDADSEESIELAGSGQGANQVEYGRWNSHYTQ